MRGHLRKQAPSWSQGTPTPEAAVLDQWVTGNIAMSEQVSGGMQQGGEREKHSNLQGSDQDRRAVDRGQGEGTRKDRHTEVTQTLSAWGSEVKMERKRDESVKEPVPETDPNGSRRKKWEEAG